ncbi:MAG: alkylation response protein AidB-like acyl-CoA dehydrogenase [Halieaceae bacterium]
MDATGEPLGGQFMNFGFSEEQDDVRNLARQLFTDMVTPERLAQYDEYREDRFDRELWNQLAETGLLGVAIAENYGGMGFGFTELALLIEEAGRSIAPVPLISHMVSAALPIQEFGGDALKERMLSAATGTDFLLTAALLEPGNEDLSRPTARASGDAESGYRISGVKTCVPFALQANMMLLAAESEQGVVVALVDTRAEGVVVKPLRVSTYEPQYRVELEGVEVQPEFLLAGADSGVEVMRWIEERTAAAICAHQVGVTDHAMRLTASYTSERQQFGVPVATFQAVGHRAADCFIDVDCLRLCTYQAVSLLDGDKPATTEVQIAKIWAGDVGHRVSYAAQHLHGGTGIDRDYSLWRYCLWARHNELMLGSSAAQLAKLGARIAVSEGFCA